MKITNLKTKGTWREIADACNTTINKGEGTKEPSSKWKRRLLLSEHSPIRQLIIKWKWVDIKYWVSVHFVRHWLGIVHWVRTQRSDRTGIDRNDIPQGALVEHECEGNAQAIINISRVRLCMKADPKTREAWMGVVEGISEVEPELAACCVPNCIYRGHCFEFQSCGYHKTLEFKFRLEEYRSGINE